jgi:hypothetical protein
MTASADETRKKWPDEGWDETVLVWNATVARITTPGKTTGRREAGPSSSEPLTTPSRSRGRRARRPSSSGPGPA